MAHNIIITSESKIFQLDFGWVDFCFSMLFYCYLVVTRRKTILIAGNIFGAFAFFIDYGFYYLLQRSHTIEYPETPPPMTPWESLLFFWWLDWVNVAAIVMWALLCLERTDMFPVGDNSSSSSDSRSKGSPPGLMELVCLPLWCCLTPWLSQICGVDDRVILSTRSSEKYNYYPFFVLFIPLLRLERQISFRNIGKVLLVGVLCGCVHQAPLFFWRESKMMSGQQQEDPYPHSHSSSSSSSGALVLVVTLLAEWPSLLCAVVYLTHLCSAPSPRAASSSPPTRQDRARGRSRRGVLLALLGVFSALCVPEEFWAALHPRHHVLQLDKQFFKLLPYMSAQSFQQLTSAVLWTVTCNDVIAPRLRTLNVASCFAAEPGDEGGGGGGEGQGEVLQVLAATAQGGSELGTQVALALGRACGLCVGAGQRVSDAYPPPEDQPPAYPSDLLLALPNMRHWPVYAATTASGIRDRDRDTDSDSNIAGEGRADGRPRPVQCVVITRHPLARLRSLYLHARNGGEKWFVESGVEKRLDLPMHESVGQFIREIGRDYLLQSHAYLLFNLQQQGCLPVQYERLRVDFNGTLAAWLRHWHVRPEVLPRLLAVLQTENPRQPHREATGRGKGKGLGLGASPQPHVTTSQHSSLFVSYVNGAIDAFDGGSMKALIAKQAAELQYDMQSEEEEGGGEGGGWAA